MERLLDNRFWVRAIAVLLAVNVVMAWSLAFIASTEPVLAQDLTSYSDTVSDSDLGAGADHTITFSTVNGVSAGESFTISFSGFNLDALEDVVNFNFLDTVGANALSSDGAAGATWDVSTTTTTVTFTSGTDTVASSSLVTIYIGTNATSSGTATGTDQIVNPNSADSYTVSVTMPVDYGETQVAILNDVLVTASVDTTLTFTVGSVAQDQTINADVSTTTAMTTSATVIPYGTLIVDEPSIGAQSLSVETNAPNGFSVTVYEDQNLTSEANDDIDLFIDGSEEATPTDWVSPTPNPSDENTFGHFGLTSEDADLNSNEFGDAQYAGNFSSTSPREVFHHDGPANGTTPNIGSTRVGYKVEITGLQEAGVYTNTLTYIATPVF